MVKHRSQSPGLLFCRTHRSFRGLSDFDRLQVRFIEFTQSNVLKHSLDALKLLDRLELKESADTR